MQHREKHFILSYDLVIIILTYVRLNDNCSMPRINMNNSKYKKEKYGKNKLKIIYKRFG